MQQHGAENFIFLLMKMYDNWKVLVRRLCKNNSNLNSWSVDLKREISFAVYYPQNKNAKMKSCLTQKEFMWIDEEDKMMIFIFHFEWSFERKAK